MATGEPLRRLRRAVPRRAPARLTQVGLGCGAPPRRRDAPVRRALPDMSVSDWLYSGHTGCTRRRRNTRAGPGKGDGHGASRTEADSFERSG